MTRDKYYTSSGELIRNPEAYAATGAPMHTGFTTKTGKRVRNPEAYAKSGRQLYTDKDINEEKSIYKVECQGGKKYIGETGDFDRRMDQHFSGRGAKVTQKFQPKSAKELERVPGYFAKEVEQEYTEKYIKKHGYNNVRGGTHTNSTTLNNDSDSDDSDDSDGSDDSFGNYDQYDDDCPYEHQPDWDIINENDHDW
jgi:predicted GIY-YIG superfamily endonuclease